MRFGIRLVVVPLLIASTGCTHLALERRTVKQASTLTDLQHQQVLNNLAMFACNPNAMAWHVKLKGGLVQVVDQAGAAFGADILLHTDPSVLMPSVNGQRGVVGQWDVQPSTEADELNLLRLAYMKAIQSTQPLNCNGNSDLAIVNEHIEQAICELALRFDILPDQKIINSVLERARTKRVGEMKDKIDKLAKASESCDGVNKQVGEAADKLKGEKPSHKSLHEALKLLGWDQETEPEGKLKEGGDLKPVAKYCQHSREIEEAHAIFAEAAATRNQPRKLVLLQEVNDKLDGLIPLKAVCMDLELQKKLLKEGRDLLDNARKIINDGKDAYTDLRKAEEEKLRKVTNYFDVTYKKELKEAAEKEIVKFCSSIKDTARDKLIEDYCRILTEMDDLFVRVHAIDREIGPESTSFPQAQGRFGSGAGKRGVFGTNARGTVREAQTLVLTAPVPQGDEARTRILRVLQTECELGYTPRDDVRDPRRRNPGLIDQAEGKIKTLQEFINEAKFSQPWFRVGCKKDVPKCACYVGHHRGCHGDCYVWVMPEDARMLRDFTQAILSLAPNESQDIALPTTGRGAAFSPPLR